MIEDFFNSLEQLSKTSKIIIAIDEFQQIANITDVKIDAILRKYIQNRTNISYIFLGSKRHILTSLFEYPNLDKYLLLLKVHHNLYPKKLEIQAF